MTNSGPSSPAEPSTRGRWHVLSRTDVLGWLDTSRAGLSSEEAARRAERFGRNELPATGHASAWAVLLRQFVSPLIGILLLTFVITLVQRHWVDAAAIGLVLAINALIGYWQERKAEASVRALQRLSAPVCRVLRDGGEREIPAAELVPGDIVPLESGERVPADLRLLEVNGLQVDESMLTGEVLPARKQVNRLPVHTPATDRTNIAFSGTLVTAGRGLGVVVGTGTNTELGMINKLVQGPGGQSPLTTLTHTLERRIGLVIGIASAGVFVAGLALGRDFSEMFRTAVALAVAAVPESLPIVLTVAMSLGVARMARHNAIVRSLPAAETLGSTTVIGSDKTGTLTRNELSVQVVWTASGVLDLRPGDGPATGRPSQLPTTVRRALRAGALTNEAVRAPAGATTSTGAPLDLTGDAVDVAMLRAAVDLGAATMDERDARWLAHTPYEPELRLSQTVREDADGRRILYVKGSPDVLAKLSTALATDEGDRPFDPKPVETANHDLAEQGMRVLATAMRVLDPDEPVQRPLPPPSGLTFLGLEGMEDPPRDGVAEAVASCRRAGITVMMITGDHPATAASIAGRLGVGTGAPPVTGREMEDLDDATLAARLRDSGVAARVTPEDKLRIVRLLQDSGEVVAITGDGVNDAPALRAASIGVAMGRSGTAVAREASDIVLTDDNFVTIVEAVRQGRVTFSAIRKATFFLLTTGVASLLSVSINLVTEQPLLFLPVQLLFINVVTNGLQDIALAFEPPEGDELLRPPRRRQEGLLSRTLWLRTAVVGAWMAGAILVTFRWALERGQPQAQARTLALTLFVMLNFWLVLGARADNRSLFAMNPLENRLLIGSAIGALLSYVGVTQWSATDDLLGLVSLSPAEWIACFVAGASVLAIIELDKAVRWLGRRPRRAGHGVS